MSNKGAFFTSITVCSILSRLIAGKISDKYGRVIVMQIAMVLLSFSHIVMAMTASPMWLLSAAGLMGFSIGVAGPAVLAWTIDRSQENKRGQAMATVYIGLEVAIGSGALIGAALYDNNPANFDLAFYVTAAITFMGVFFLRGVKK